MVQIGGLVSFSRPGSTGSGITSINTQAGPAITIKGVNGIDISTPSSNCILVDGVALSGVNGCFATSFTNITSATINHGLGTEDILVQVKDTSGSILTADEVTATDINNVLLKFNRAISGRITIIACGGTVNTASFEESRRYALLVS